MHGIRGMQGLSKAQKGNGRKKQARASLGYNEVKDRQTYDRILNKVL